MNKNFLRFRNCFMNMNGIRTSNIIKRGAAVLLSFSILAYLVIPVDTADADTSASELNSIIYSSTYYGDINNDHEINSIDYAKLKLLIFSPLQTTDTINIKAAELNGDGNIDAIDLALLKQFVLGKIERFPVMDTHISTVTGSNINVNINESLKISLEENLSTGYSWSYTISEENAINLISEESFSSYTPGMAGVPSQKVWTFEALKPGKYTLLYTYSRSWETDIPPIETVKVDIYVSTTTGSIINVNKGETFKVSLLEGGFVGYTWSYTVSEENAIALISEDSFYQNPGWADAFSQVVWTFTTLKPGKYTLLFSRRPIDATVQCEINVQ
jgi:inhibitor of cysteine peptidase